MQGALSLYVPPLLAEEALRRRAVLGRAYFGAGPPLPRAGALFSVAARDVPARAYVASGFVPLRELAVRADALERLVHRVRAGASPRELARRLRCAADEGPALRGAIEAALARH